MTTVYLDTSVAINEAFLKSRYFDAFLKACALLQYPVVIPEIVIDELKGNFSKKLNEKLEPFQKAKKELGKLIDLNMAEICLSNEVDLYADWLDELIGEHGIVIAPYPDILAKELVQQSYTAKKLFKDSGEGHKDYVVWKTIQGHIASNKVSHPNIFLTNNTKDFCNHQEGQNATLHDHLVEAIETPDHRPKVYTSIRSAFESELAPNLEGMTLNDIPDLGPDDIDTLTGKMLLEDLPSRSIYGLEGIPFSNEITISCIGAHSVDSVSLKKVDDEVIISVLGAVEVEVDGFIDKFNYYHSENDELIIYVVDGNWNDHVMLVSSTTTTPFNLTIFYSKQTGEVTGHEISLPHEIEDEWPYK